MLDLENGSAATESRMETSGSAMMKSGLKRIIRKGRKKNVNIVNIRGETTGIYLKGMETV
jgi:rhamnogalacturonyl hydrolase YesR